MALTEGYVCYGIWKIGYPYAVHELGPLSYTIHHSKWMKFSNIRPETLKLLKENREKI